MKWAYIDETVRPGRMLIAAVIIDTGDLRHVRQAMRSALLPGQRRLHLTDERAVRRHLILDLVARQPLEAVVVRGSTAGRRRATVRRDLLNELVEALVATEVQRLVLDRVAEELLDVDRATLATALGRLAASSIVYGHEPSTAEPLLWAADAVAWAAGAGGHSSARIARIVRRR